MLSAEEFFAIFENPWLCHQFPCTFLTYYDVMESGGPLLRHRMLHHFGANSSVFTRWSGSASLHRVGEHLSGWDQFFACSPFACTSHAISPRPGLVKLLALSNFLAYIVTRVSQDITASVVWFFLDTICLRCFLLLDRMILVTGIEPSGSLRRTSFFVHIWRLRNGSLVSHALFRGGLICPNLFD